ncbi:hypothetical protein L596_013062 [Steinernema carpocapsae]|uniref:Uncharacterized protein n=1 Tax=Steinernema carpocapsae TaxID=34508 RepID=A0A4U5NZK0_STECR|nr:hypothetical protein L596_013062 [Steinernema carpocapsae]
MTDKGTIVLPKFHGTWGEADIGEFEWTSRMCSSCRSNVSSGQNCQLISCFQKTGSRTILWSCSAAGTFFMTNPSTAKQSVFNFWNGSFGNQCTEFHAR